MRSSSVETVYVNEMSNSSLFVCGSIGRLISNYSGRREAAGAEEEAPGSATADAVATGDEARMMNGFSRKSVAQDDMVFSTDSAESVIRLGSIKVLSIETGTTFQIGNSCSVELASRVRDIRRG